MVTFSFLFALCVAVWFFDSTTLQSVGYCQHIEMYFVHAQGYD